MASVTVTVRNPSGLHARPAATFVRAAAGLPVEVTATNLSRDPDRHAAARSILAVMQLGVAQGHELRLEADGEGAEAALDELRAPVESGLGEPLGA